MFLENVCEIKKLFETMKESLFKILIAFGTKTYIFHRKNRFFDFCYRPIADKHVTPKISQASIDHFLSSSRLKLYIFNTRMILEIPNVVRDVSRANLQLQCKDANRFVLKHEPGVYVVEHKNKSRDEWISPVIVRSTRFFFLEIFLDSQLIFFF